MQNESRFSEKISFIALQPGTYTLGEMIMEAGEVSASHNWKGELFASEFTETPVIPATITTENGGNNCHPDIRNTNPEGFEVRIYEDLLLDGAHAVESITYIATTPGQHPYVKH